MKAEIYASRKTMEMAKHLRPYAKRKLNKCVRRKAKEDLTKQVK